MDWRKDKNIKAFVSHVKKRCKETGVKLTLVDSHWIEENNCAGYFDCDNLDLKVATRDLQEPIRWVTLLAHEYCHLEQWSEEVPLWGKTVKGHDIYTLFMMWLDGVVELSEEQLTEYTNCAMEVELDCEKRTTEVIKKFNLPFDVEEYVQRSNAYALQYQFIKKHRRWNIPGQAPSSLKEVYSLMSTKFDMDYYSLPQDIERAYMKCFFET